MGLLDFLSSREKKVTNQKLADDISKLCDELTTGIIELSNKANKINELKEKYKQSQSELENSSTNPDSAAASPKASKSIFSSWFGSDEDVPPPPLDQPQHDVNSLAPAAVDNIDANSLSAASTAQLASPAQTIDQSAITPQTPLKDYNSSSDNSLSVGSDMFSSSSSDSIQQQPLEAASPASPALPPASPALPPASPALPALPPASPELPPASPALPPPSLEPIAQDAATLSPEQQIVKPQQPQQNKNDEQDNLASILGGKNKKKSKRSKQTIRKTDKKSNSVTQKHKNNNSTDKARAQGLAQAKLQAQGQSMI